MKKCESAYYGCRCRHIKGHALPHRCDFKEPYFDKKGARRLSRCAMTWKRGRRK